ncbi:MAG: hypothetical protein U0836_03095 [Pirellulales bacterium]
MLKCLPACAAACLVCLPAAVDARELTFRQYREATTCVLFGGELLLTSGAPEWLSGGPKLPTDTMFGGARVDLVFELPRPSARPRVDQLASHALCERCQLVEQSEGERELAATLNMDCLAVDALPTSAALIQSGGAMTDSLIVFDPPTSGGRSTGAGFADVSSDPALLLRLAMVLAVGCFPPLLRDYTQRPVAT